MTARSIKVGIGVIAALGATVFIGPTAAYADYAPTNNDVVGVGSDTLQQLVNFAADGDYSGTPGYNSNVRNKFISIDATADANSRLAYGSGGNGTNCTPGTGTTKGTGNDNGNHTEASPPCVLNPTVVLRAGTSPTQRPNGSGAGFNLLVQDTDGNGKGKGLVDFARASSKRSLNGSAFYNSVTVGRDPLQILVSSSSNAPANITKDQLTAIYQCTLTNWSDIGGQSGTIKPLLPQPGSGTRDYFLGQIGVTSPGNCVTNVEENDPEAIDATGTATAPNALEPMSVGRLNLFKGLDSTGTSLGAGYFKDPSCPFPPALSTTPDKCVGSAGTLTPNVKLLGGFAPTRDLFIYFRAADINSTKKFQPGSTLNWVRTMLYNPCPAGATNCVTDPATGAQYGPGGAPYFASGTGQAAISSAGVVPFYAFNGAGPN